MFSRISVALRKANACTLDVLRRVISTSYTPRPSTIYVENIYDMKSWLCSVTYELKYHSQPHAFRFKENANGEVEMQYRHWANDGSKVWMPPTPIIVSNSLPVGWPNLLKPLNKAKNCPEPEDMEKAVTHLSHRMSEADISWWKSFMCFES